MRRRVWLIGLALALLLVGCDARPYSPLGQQMAQTRVRMEQMRQAFEYRAQHLGEGISQTLSDLGSEIGRIFRSAGGQ